MKLTEAIKSSIEESVLCWLATADENGQPNVSPKELFTFDEEDCLVIAYIASPGSRKNIKRNPKVAVSFIHVFKQKGFQLKGIAEIIDDKDPRFSAKSHKLKKMAGEAFSFNSLISVDLETFKPIIAPSYLFYPDTSEEDMISQSKKQYLD